METNPFDGFETYERAHFEDSMRLSRVVLTQANSESLVSQPPFTSFLEFDELDLHSLQCDLEAGLASGVGSSTLASSISMRSFRLRFIEAIAALVADHPENAFKTFTVLNAGWAIPPAQLGPLSPKRLVNKLRKDLHDASVLACRGPLLAVVHGEFEPTAGVYTLHVHGLGVAEKVECLRKLGGTRGYCDSVTGASWLVTKRLMTSAEGSWDPVDGPREMAQQASYLVKSWWPQKAIRCCEDGEFRRDRRGQRIDEPYHVQHLVWLHRQRMRDLVLMSDVWSPRRGHRCGPKLVFTFSTTVQMWALKPLNAAFKGPFKAAGELFEWRASQHCNTTFQRHACPQ